MDITDQFCGKDCNQDKELPERNHIDLKDGIKNKLNKNPSLILKNKNNSFQFFLCELASKGLFPEQGGVYDQETDFLEYYQIYIQWLKISEQVNTVRASKE